MHERFVLILSNTHPSVNKDMNLDNFCELEYVLASPDGGGFRGSVDDTLESLGRSIKVVGSLNSFLLVPNVVKSSLYAAVVPEQLTLAQADGLKIISIPFDMPGFNIFQSWHPRSKSDKGHIWLRNLIHSQNSSGK